MKTKEFIGKVKELGFEIEESDISIEVINRTHENVCSVSEISNFVLDTDWPAFEGMGGLDREYLCKLAIEYASTPIEERGEEKMYVVEIKTTDSTLHLWRATDGSGDTDFILKDRTTTGQRRFTKKEIESIDSRFLQFAIEVTSND